VLREALDGQPTSGASIRASICPYRGLEPFREEDAPFFCGRDEAVCELVAQVQSNAFVAVVGPSGSGKSSLVFAGLLPALRKESRRRTWDVVSFFRPGKAPLFNLAEAFASRAENAGPAQVATYLKNEAKAYREGAADLLAHVVDRRLDAAPEKPDRLLIYVDQWEELYAMAPQAEDKERPQHARDVERLPPDRERHIRTRARSEFKQRCSADRSKRPQPEICPHDGSWCGYAPRASRSTPLAGSHW
jgi:energy-coupling factor transporter ATP-binding protein EcfA2